MCMEVDLIMTNMFPLCSTVDVFTFWEVEIPYWREGELSDFVFV